RVGKEEKKVPIIRHNSKSSIAKTFVNWITVFITLYWKNLLQDIRNPLTICLQYFSPISQILLFALCIGGHPFGINIGIVNKDSSRLAVGNEFLKSIDGVIVNQIHFNNLKEAIEAAKRRKVWAVIEIPRDYSYALVDRIISSNVSNKLVKRSTILVHADLSDKIVALTTLRTLHNDYILFTRRLLSDYDEDPDVANPIIKIVKPIYGSNTKNYRAFRDFMLPGMILNLTFAMAIAMSSLTLIAERSGQTFERNYVAGVNATQMLMSHIAARITLSALYVVIVVWTPLLLFDIRVKGNVWIATLLVLIQNITGMTCGMLISATCKEIMMAMVTTSGCFMFFLFMSGTLWPVESIPYSFRWMCYISPTTLPTEAFRHILYRNWSITSFGVSIGFGVSFIWTIIFFCCAAKLFRYNK
ncbi:ABC transporter G family member 20-like protein, partial [Leptotrombidium deliense]